MTSFERTIALKPHGGYPSHQPLTPQSEPRKDGLTEAEGVVMDALVAAVKAFAALPRQHPDEMRDFCDGIHKCQDQLAVRVCRAAFPAGWPTKPPKPSRRTGTAPTVTIHHADGRGPDGGGSPLAIAQALALHSRLRA